MLETPSFSTYWAFTGELVLEVPVWTGSALDAEMPALWLVHQLLSNPLWARNLEETLHWDGERAACHETKGTYLPPLEMFGAGQVPDPFASLSFYNLPLVKWKIYPFKLESELVCCHALLSHHPLLVGGKWKPHWLGEAITKVSLIYCFRGFWSNPLNFPLQHSGFPPLFFPSL